MNQRYADEIDEAAIAAIRHKGGLPASKLALWSAISCLLYQCSEGDTDKIFPEFAELEAFRNSLSREIIYSLPEYEQLATAW